MRSHSEVVFPKTPEDAELMRRICQFNVTVLQESFREYKAQHPEEVLPDGIASGHQAQIFRLFNRLHGDKFPGTGIGLAIVQRGVERMGGRVGVQSTPRQGSRF